MIKNIPKSNSIQIMFVSDKTIEFYNIVIVVRSAIHKGNKYYSQVNLDECLDKLAE